MNDQQLDRNLQSIGKECFVAFFENLRDPKLPDEAVARHIAGEWGCDYAAALGLRVRPARRIIAAGRASDALAVFAGSVRFAPPRQRQSYGACDGQGVKAAPPVLLTANKAMNCAMVRRTTKVLLFA